MQTITTISKSLVIVFFITCSIILHSQYGTRIFPHYISYSDMSSEIAVVYKTNKTRTSSIWIEIGNQLKLDHSAQDPRVKAEMRKILADKKSFQAILNRSAPYIYYIYTQTQQQNLPAEIALIPIIESEYNANDYSNTGATGLWQLMPGTAHGLGVKMGSGYDGRRNVIASTKAALTFLEDLEKNFNDNWNLVFAAYNCGPGCVFSATRKAKSTDYFELKLPLETTIYVPRLLAIAEIIKHADEYGIVLPAITNEPYFMEVKVKKSESLSSYAKSTGTDLDELKKLNPDHKYEKATMFSDTLLVPVNNGTI